MKRAVLILAVLCFPSITRGQVLTSTYKDACYHFGEADADKASAALCAGYTTGWMEAANGTNVTIKGTAYLVIFADNVTARQFILVTLKYIDIHPETLNKPISETLVDALMAAKMMGVRPLETGQGRGAQ
jgi:hypothetical protein